jgi:hypothetical protein
MTALSHEVNEEQKSLMYEVNNYLFNCPEGKAVGLFVISLYKKPPILL